MEFSVTVDDVCPVSTNDAYIPTKGKNGKGSFLRKSSALIKFQQELTNKVKQQNLDQLISFIEYCKSEFEYLGFKVEIGIGMNDLYHKNKMDLKANDASNYIKPIEDIFSNLLEVDDKYNLIVTAYKYKYHGKNYQLKIKYTPLDFSKVDPVNLAVTVL